MGHVLEAAAFEDVASPEEEVDQEAVWPARSGGFEAERAPWNTNSTEPVGLWDMLEFAARPFVSMTAKLMILKCRVDKICERGEADSPLADHLARAGAKALEIVNGRCDELGLTAATEFISEDIDRFRRWGVTARELSEACSNATRLIQHDLARMKFAYIPVDRASMLDSMEKAWGPAWEKFRSTEIDGREASLCYALDLHTACVFHCMLVLEKGIDALAKAVGVRRGRKEWGSLLDNIERAIESERNKKATQTLPPRAAKNREERLTFLSEAAKEFHYFKDAWRNHTAHGRRQYDPFEAARILTHVREFMVHISKRLREVR